MQFTGTGGSALLLSTHSSFDQCAASLYLKKKVFVLKLIDVFGC